MTVWVQNAFFLITQITFVDCKPIIVHWSAVMISLLFLSFFDCISFGLFFSILICLSLSHLEYDDDNDNDDDGNDEDNEDEKNESEMLW